MDKEQEEKQWLNPYKVAFVDRKAETTANFWVKLDAGKPERVDVALERKEPGKEPQRLVTTLEKLEQAADEVRAFYARTAKDHPDKPELAPIRDQVVKMSWTKEEEPDVSVLLITHKNGEVQHLITSRAELEKTVEEGRRLERTHGIDRGYCTVIDMNSLEIHGERVCSARVVASIPKEDEFSAHSMVHQTKSFGYLVEPRPVACEKGDRIWFRSDESVDTSWGRTQVASEAAIDAQFIRERLSENYIVVEWGHARPPMLGEEARYEGLGIEYNGKPKDFRGGPVRGGELSDQAEPVYALIRKDEQKYGVGVVVAVSHDRQEMTTKLMQLEQQHQDVKKLVEEVRAQNRSVDLSKAESRQDELRQEYKRKL